MVLDAGTKAPLFSAQTNGGNKIKLSDYRKRWVIMFFYPEDDTEVCTREACSFNDNLGLLENEGAVVLGVSPDPPESHDKFIEKYSLGFTLVSDPGHKIAAAYGTYGEKVLYGHRHMGIIRSTFIIDPKGMIVKSYKNIRVDKHVARVLADLKELKGKK